ncbi:MAG: LysO family transporter, partial [Spirochaetia bacterium]|nr:LysO family transporter [Spirochaetia bacterium]
ALLLIPVLAASKRPYTAIGAGGATAMDVTLPLIEQCAGPDSVPVSFASGATLSLLVPVLVPLFYRLG